MPAAQRAEWFAEWGAELWYVKRSQTLFCLGSFRDAFWLRRNRPASRARTIQRLESPLRCLLFLAVLAATSLFFALRLHLLSETLLPSAYVDARNLADIHAPVRSGRQFPTVSLAQYNALVDGTRDKFTDVAFYRPVMMRVQTARREPVDLSVGVASANLFQVLETPIALAGPRSLILSHAAWRRYFDGDSHIVGRMVDLGGQPVVVGGVLQGSLGRLPGWSDAWLLEDQLHLAELPPHKSGFVLGRVRTSASRPQPGLPWSVSVPNADGGQDRLECSSLAAGAFVLGYRFLFLVSPLLVLSAITPLALGYYPRNRYSPSGATRQCRWILLGIKLALLLPAVYYGSFDLASLTTTANQPLVMMVGLIVGLRWTLIDQRQRCPVCLRLLTSPTRIGGASRTLLEWYGTELICARGHGLLYVPEIPTSCYSTQRWQYRIPPGVVSFRRQDENGSSLTHRPWLTGS